MVRGEKRRAQQTDIGSKILSRTPSNNSTKFTVLANVRYRQERVQYNTFSFRLGNKLLRVSCCKILYVQQKGHQSNKRVPGKTTACGAGKNQKKQEICKCDQFSFKLQKLGLDDSSYINHLFFMRLTS